MRPPGPDPLINDRSMPLVAAKDFAAGLAMMRPCAEEAGAAGAAGVAGVAGVEEAGVAGAGASGSLLDAGDA